MLKVYFAVVLAVALIALASGQCLSDKEDAPPARNAKANLYKGEMDFALAALESINRKSSNENIFFSPYSIFHATLLAYFGARGQTEASLKTALRLQWAENKGHIMHAYRHEKSSRAQRFANSSVEFRSADRIYLDQKQPIRDCMQNYFDDELKSLDFGGHAEQSRVEINTWIENLTKGNIKNMLSEGLVTSQTQLVLANAAYFKGTWVSKFDAKDTKQEVFYKTSSDLTFVEMMAVNGSFYHAVNEKIGAHILELPYDGGDISMYVLLPPTVDGGLENVLRNLNVQNLQQALEEGSSREVHVKFPKFAFEKEVELVPVLLELGVGDLFSPTANITGFTGTDLKLDEAKHKSKIEVDENGATAASATVLFSFRSSRVQEPAEFVCNHPFFFFIYDNKSKAVLFAGIYRDPDSL